MSSTPVYQIGTLCEDCLRYGQQNFLKPFYINLDEQIIKCESSTCMFPYMRKPTVTEEANSKPVVENTIFLEEFIEQRLQEIDDESPNATKPIVPKYTTKEEVNNSDMFDFSAIFMSSPIKTEVKEKPMVVQSVKQEPNVQPVVMETKSTRNSWNIDDTKANIDTCGKEKNQAPRKIRISRCLSDVKAPIKSSRKSKSLNEKIEPVLVIEPNSGKSMRPLDLIKRYMKN